MKIVITGGAGFIGSHLAEFYAKENEVVVFDNLSRHALLQKKTTHENLNWDYLKKIGDISLIKGDIRNFDAIKQATKNADVVIHAAAQTGVTSSIKNPVEDFSVNAFGTFNVLEAARKNDVKTVLFCSTNKVYGDNVNRVPIHEEEKRYSFLGIYKNGISEDLSIDMCKHTPYGSSKLTGDLYAQDYSLLYGLKTGVFRMSCIYGTRQFGLEDQGWIAWFTIASLLEKKLTIYGNGKQVRDVLYINDLVDLFNKFVASKLKHVVLNTGGGPENTLSLLELMEILENITKKKVSPEYSDWRPSDQKVFISDISKAEELLGWKPKIKPEEGIRNLVYWVQENKDLFN